MKNLQILLVAFTFWTLGTGTALAHILAMVNYESKTEEALKTMKIENHGARKEGIAVIDVEPGSETFGKILADISFPANTIGHHIFYNRDMSKAYLTTLGQGLMYVMDMNPLEYKFRTIDVSECKVGEDLIFSEDNRTWYLTCMGSANIVVGDAQDDTVTKVISLPTPYPHGIAIHSGIDRILVTNTIRPDMKEPGETISVIEASTGNVLSSYKLSEKESPSGVVPVEILFVPGSNPPVAYITTMFGNALWTATWNPGTKEFDVKKVHDFSDSGSNVPLEIYFNDGATKMYTTSANPGHMHVFDLSANPSEPQLLKTIPMAAGAHHVAFTKDWKYAFVQNALLNLKGMDDGSIKVFDLESETVIASIDTLKNKGFNPNSIVLLPKWNHSAGH